MKAFLKKIVLPLLLALSMCSLMACSAEDVEDVLDIAIDVLDALETEEGGNTSYEETKKPNSSSAALSGDKQDDPTVERDGWYDTKDEVALYIHIYEELPGNYLTKNEARDLGWDSSKGNLWDVAEGMSIGGDRFYNNEDQLPEEKGRKYYECDINYHGGYRGSERIVFSNDGLIYYTDDHYDSFTCLYGEE